MSIQFAFYLAQPEALQAAMREKRRLKAGELSGEISIAEQLDPLSWPDALEEAMEEVIGVGPRLERDGTELYPAVFLVADGWVKRVAALTDEQAERVVERWADLLGESLQPGERPEAMVDDLHALVRLCGQAQRDGLALLYAVNY